MRRWVFLCTTSTCLVIALSSMLLGDSLRTVNVPFRRHDLVRHRREYSGCGFQALLVPVLDSRELGDDVL